MDSSLLVQDQFRCYIVWSEAHIRPNKFLSQPPWHKNGVINVEFQYSSLDNDEHVHFTNMQLHNDNDVGTMFSIFDMYRFIEPIKIDMLMLYVQEWFVLGFWLDRRIHDWSQCRCNYFFHSLILFVSNWFFIIIHNLLVVVDI